MSKVIDINRQPADVRRVLDTIDEDAQQITDIAVVYRRSDGVYNMSYSFYNNERLAFAKQCFDQRVRFEMDGMLGDRHAE